jgi:Periplasmic serine proteases (ClpP class)
MTSPGGSVSASEQIYKIISNFKKIHSIPVYFHTNELLTSGAYWVSLSGDKIYANYGSIIGSIGVKGPDWLYYNDPTLISNGILGSSVESPKGIQMFSNFAGNSKDIFNPFRQPNEKEKLELQKMVDEIYEDFLTIVASSRKIEKKFLKEEIGAMFFNSKRAKQYFLIDDQKEINEIIDIISNKLKLKNKKIIINTNNETYNLFNIPKLMNRNYIDKNMLYKRVCDNFTNGFSSISTINYSINC